MSTLIGQLVMLVAGLGLLGWGGDLLVRASVTIAVRLGVSPLIVGLTIVAFGTSAPELAFNLIASISGSSGLVFGNIVGSNIANIGLILGVAALLQPLTVHSDMVRREIPIMIGASLLMVGMAFVIGVAPAPASGGLYTRLEGVVLLALFGVLAAMTVLAASRQRGSVDPSVHGASEQDLARTLPVAIGLFVVGLLMLTGGAKLAELGAVGIARGLGVSETIIGLTIVAVGTSLPELSATLVAARRRQADLAVGNIVGSNLFNILAIFGLSAAVRPIAVPEGAALSLAVMCALAVAMLVLSRTRSGRLSRVEGVLLLVVYGAYLGYQCWEALATRQTGG